MTTPTFTAATYSELPFRHTDAAWQMYQRAFTPLNALALQRHLMTDAEFYGMAYDDRIDKHVVFDGDRLVGISVTTNRLESWPLISPAYCERRWPKLYRQSRIWYVGFICVDPPSQSSGIFDQLLLTSSAPAREDGGGLFLMDFCSLNVRRGLPALAQKILAPHSSTGLKLAVEDTQEFWSFRFGGNR